LRNMALVRIAASHLKKRWVHAVDVGLKGQIRVEANFPKLDLSRNSIKLERYVKIGCDSVDIKK